MAVDPEKEVKRPDMFDWLANITVWLVMWCFCAGLLLVLVLLLKAVKWVLFS